MAAIRQAAQNNENKDKSVRKTDFNQKQQLNYIQTDTLPGSTFSSGKSGRNCFDACEFVSELYLFYVDLMLVYLLFILLLHILSVLETTDNV